MARGPSSYYTATDDYMTQQLAAGRKRLSRRDPQWDPPPERPSVKLRRAENDAAGKACDPFRRK